MVYARHKLGEKKQDVTSLKVREIEGDKSSAKRIDAVKEGAIVINFEKAHAGDILLFFEVLC